MPRICALLAALALVHCHSSCGDSDATPTTQPEQPAANAPADTTTLGEHARMTDPGRRPLALHRFVAPAPSSTADAESAP